MKKQLHPPHLFAIAKEMNPEEQRLLDHRQHKTNWKLWGPYLSERAWGTVREDYGKGGPWNSFPFHQAYHRVYRWGEDGLGGICDRLQYICFAFAFWNHKDPILKERLFGLNSTEGNHGEDVKELYYYLDATPTSSYLKMLYKYPQREFPYQQLIDVNHKRGLHDQEYEILDTDAFNDNRYFDIFIEHAKAQIDDILCRVTIHNRGPEAAPITFLPTVWFRNTWKWGYPNGPTGDDGEKPHLFEENGNLHLYHPVLKDYYFYLEKAPLIFCDNDNEVPYPKDSFHRYIIKNEQLAINPEKKGTKAAGHYRFNIQPGKSETLYFRLSKFKRDQPFANKEEIFRSKIEETNAFYKEIQKETLSDELKKIQRQAFAGILFSKQFYYLDQLQWLKGDPHYPAVRDEQRNESWDHLAILDILSISDKWEFPYLCAWDNAFHCIPMTLVDPDFAKRQLTLMTREWYMHPNGQFPAYEWNFSDVNPPVQPWALLRTYKIDAKKFGTPDRPFLEGLFDKLLLNFTWWVNKKDAEGNNIFQGGFLGMDNISVFNRSLDLPMGGHVDQSDGSAWMSFYCISMMKIALHLAEQEPVYQDSATKFFEHFLRIAAAMSTPPHSLWDEKDGFFYDVLHLPNDRIIPLKVRSLVGLLPLLAVETLDPELLEKMPVFKRRMDWFLHKRPETSRHLACIYAGGIENRHLLSIVNKEHLIRILSYMLDEEEFLSPHGIRSVSKYHEKHPYHLHVDGTAYKINYVPADSDNRMYGGNSNWRGPVWFPINFLLIEALQKFHHYYGDSLKVEFPTRSGNYLNLWDVATELSKRLIHIFTPDHDGKRPVYGDTTRYRDDPLFKDLILFYEYFNGDNGAGIGASHQTGWTALVVKLIQQSDG